MDWALKSAVEMAELHPGEFDLPSKKETASLKPGDFAKLIFSFVPKGDGPSGQRMWVNIMSVHARGYYRGRLANDPLYAPIKMGDWVTFDPDNILAVMRKKTAIVGREEIGWIHHGKNDPKRHEK